MNLLDVRMVTRTENYEELQWMVLVWQFYGRLCTIKVYCILLQQKQFLSICFCLINFQRPQKTLPKALCFGKRYMIVQFMRDGDSPLAKLIALRNKLFHTSYATENKLRGSWSTWQNNSIKNLKRKTQSIYLPYLCKSQIP